MPLYLKENPYRGINAHYNSLLQAMDGGWMSFHNAHITHLRDALNRLLPPNYYAVTEQSLQILSETEFSRRTIPDVAVLHRGAKVEPSLTDGAATAPTLEVPLREVIELSEEEQFSAVVIYQQPDRLVTRIELLSPANKTSARGPYLAMRQKALFSKLNLVELDYLHETPSLFPHLLPEAYPYCVVVSEPKGDDIGDGIMQFYCFHVDDPFPNAPIPLLAGEKLAINWGEVYNFSFTNDRRTQFMLDYSQPPLNFERYSAFDQARILACMERVAA